MSLQGTLDTFALPDVLRLLASTKKTGHLRIDGSRGAGNVWCDSGHVVAADADQAGSQAALAEVVFELLRFPDGAFSFDGDMTTSNAGAPADVEPLLEEAGGLLDEWRDIETAVPSLDAWISLSAELPRPQVAVKAEQWRLLVTIGGGTTVAAVGATHGLGELPVSRAVKDLLEAGLVQLDLSGVAPAAPVPAPAPRAEPVSHPPAAPPAVEGRLDHDESAAELAAIAETAHVDAGDAPELARQLAQLGPEAARAVAAAAQANTVEEREAALASIEGEVDGEPINRGLLLKFLSSVRS